MTSNEVFTLIEEIASEPSKNGKQALLAEHASDAMLTRVLVAALDPFTTYGVAKRPETTLTGTEQFEADTWLVLEQLAKRELSGNAAVQAVTEQLEALHPHSATLFWRIITKDLRAGFSESTVNKAIPGLITTFDCMLAHPFDEGRVKSWPQMVEPKLDGVRVLAFVRPEAGTVHFFSRSGKEFTTFDHLKAPLLELAFGLKDTVFDGEVVSGSFNKTVGDVRRKSEQATDASFYVFDALPLEVFNLDGKEGVGQPYWERRAALSGIFNSAITAGRCTDGRVVLNKVFLANSHDEIRARYDWARGAGLEGVIVKDPGALYHRRRNHGWMKIKNEASVDVQIVGAEEGTGKFEGVLGALVVDYKGVRVNVGSGLTDSQRISFWGAVTADQASGLDIELVRLGERPPGFVLGRLIEVEYHEETPDGSLRHPRFVRFRDDLPMPEREAA